MPESKVRGRRSIGKVKLRRANGTLMLTIPKTIEDKVEHLIGKEFEAAYTQTTTVEMITYVRKRFNVVLAR